MQQSLQLDKEKYKFFIFENESCLQLLKIQETELAQWGKFIETFLLQPEIESLSNSEKKETDLLFKIDIKKTKEIIQDLIDLVDLQHKRIKNNLLIDIENDHEGSMIQDILREKVKQLQSQLIDLRYKFMSHVANYH